MVDTIQDALTEPIAMDQPLDILSRVRIAAPCTVAWASMEGDERVRFCGKCQKHVYNFTAMTPQEAAAIVAEKEGRLCVRMYQRPDGTLLAGNCPIGLQRLRRRFGRLAGMVAACLGFLIGLTVTLGNPWRRTGFTRLRNLETAKAAEPIFNWLGHWRHLRPFLPPGQWIAVGSAISLTPEELQEMKQRDDERREYESYVPNQTR